MQWGAPCEPSDLVHFRHRIGEAGVQMILAVSIGVPGPKGGEKEVVIDSTVQEKNVTYPTDTKLYRKVIVRCWKLHEPHIYCVAKEHKKYEFGTKASVVLTKTGGIIVGAVAHDQNLYDGHTLPEVLQQTEALTGSAPTVAIVDRG